MDSVLYIWAVFLFFDASDKEETINGKYFG